MSLKVFQTVVWFSDWIRSQFLSHQHNGLPCSLTQQQLIRGVAFGLDDSINVRERKREREERCVCVISLRSSIHQLNTQLQCPVSVHRPPASRANPFVLLFPHRHLEDWCVAQKQPLFLSFHLLSSLSLFVTLSFCPCWNMLHEI